MIREQLRRDNIWMGILLGIAIPAVLFGILTGIVCIVEQYTGEMELVTSQKILLLSVVPNLFLLRHYLLKLKYDLTGRGILTSTFVVAILFVVLEFSK